MMMETVPSGTILRGRYRIERVLGSGGFGHVYLSIDLKTHKQYALKEYLVTGPSGQAQLQHEARVLSQLHHPNLPAFHEAFDERGHYYVVLSYIEGSDLTDLIRFTRLRNEMIPIKRIMDWLLSVCDAVIFLHSQQPALIHRDIKPDNIRITPQGTAILVDLGNVKSAADGARTLLFIRHQGTPGYAPQEQYPGGSGTDVRSDVYALGGTLYFALTAHEPPSVSARNQSLQQNLRDLPSLQEQLANNPPLESTDPNANAARQYRSGVAKPSKHTPHHMHHLAQLAILPPDLLDQLNRIITKAMAMKQKERYQSVTDLSHDLKKVAAALPASPAPENSTRPLDPHSTQPDLPLIYETIQAAKGNTDPPSRGVPTQPNATPGGRPQGPPTQPSATPAPTVEPTRFCLRCSTPLEARAAFCPRCGTSVDNMRKGHVDAASTAPDTRINSQRPPQQNKMSKLDTTPDKTMLLMPRRDALVQTYSPPMPKSGPNSSSMSPPIRSKASTITPVQHISSGAAQYSSKASASIVNPSPVLPPHHKLQLRIIVVITIVLVILIVIMTWFVILNSLPGKHPPRHSNQHFSIEAQVSTHERNFPFSVTPAAAFATFGIRTCRQGLSIAAGLP